MKLRKPNAIFLGIALSCIVLFCMTFYYSWTDRNIRLNGSIRKEKIINISGRTNYATVLIDGELLYAGSLEDNNIKLGDSIEVRYIPNEYCVIQERVNPNIYYLYFILETALLIIGIVFFIESLKGKSIWSYL